MDDTPLRIKPADDHTPRDAHHPRVVGTTTSASHSVAGSQAIGAGGSTSGSQWLPDAHTAAAAGPFLRDPLLGVFADILDDFEKVRIANENRLRALTDSSDRGHGLSVDNPDVARLAALVDATKSLEHQGKLNLCRAMRAHPLWPWAKPLAGVGEKQFARLLAVIGDPYWNDLHDRPRTKGELWAYCGYHVIPTSGSQRDHVPYSHIAAGSTCHPDRCIVGVQNDIVGVAPKRRRGERSNWNEDARKRCYLIAESCMKQRGHYRDVYDAARAKYADATHRSACVRCGPAGHPAAEGSVLSLGHQHARGLRAVSKEFLKDLWRESKRLHEEMSKQ